MDLLARIDRWATIAPLRPAHVSGGRTLNYGDLVRRSDALAAALAQAFPGDRSPIVILGHKEPEMLIGFLGSVKAGHPYVPVDIALPPQRVDRIAELAGAGLVLTPERVETWSAGGAPGPRREAEPSDPHYIIFTSGSTGEPKGVTITLGCLTTFVDWMLSEHAFGEGSETFLNQATFSFDLSVMDLYLSLSTGGTLYSITKEEIASPKHLFESLAASDVTVWVSTPTFAQVCLVERHFGAAMLPRLKRFLFCGETLPPAVASQLLARFPGAEVWNTYGPTEATVATTSVRVDRGMLTRYPVLPVGYPMKGSRVLLVDEAGNAVPRGGRGQIVIAGPNVSPGYLGRPDLNERSFFVVDGQRAYRTGDWGHFEDGLLFFEGRMDRQIKLHGYRIELGDVEVNLCAVPGVWDAVVLPILKDGRPESLEAFVVLSAPPAPSDFEAVNTLRGHLAERLPAHMLPLKFHFLKAFPMTANGKVDRQTLARWRVANPRATPPALKFRLD